MTNKRKVNKQKLITKHFLSGGTLTDKECADKFGHRRLSAVVHILRKRWGFDSIKNKDLSVKDRFGNMTHPTRYIPQLDIINKISDPLKNKKEEKIVHQLYSEEEMLELENEKVQSKLDDTPNTYDDFLDHWREVNEEQEKKEKKGLWKQIRKFFNG